MYAYQKKKIGFNENALKIEVDVAWEVLEGAEGDRRGEEKKAERKVGREQYGH